MSGRKSRTKGHNYERLIVSVYQALGWRDAVSSRAESKTRDDQKVDLCYTSPFNIQCKATETAPNMHKLLASMPQEGGRYNLVYHKRSYQGSTVTMTGEDFEELVEMMVEHGVLTPDRKEIR